MTERQPEFTKVASLADLRAKGTLVVKADGKQIALFMHRDRVLACNNRCQLCHTPGPLG